ncbi:TPA: hypothetical protein EYP66_06855 [Candidatus Poribacteria bacterium]|nr:hypothetical protein [Candidatus Poribacteria bacterium]
MKITKIETFKVAVPYIPAIRKYRPTEHTDRPILLIKVYTDEGIVGIGEGGRGGDVDHLIANWIGKDPMEMNLQTTGAPFQQALYDIVGKAHNLPAYKLMGDCYRDEVPVGYWSCYMAPKDTGKEAEVAAKRGFTNHKLKARPWDIVQQAEEITKAAGPDYAITVDPNDMFETVEQSVRLAKELEPYNILCFEDPIAKDDFAGFRAIRSKVDISIAPHLGGPSNVLAAIKADAADMFNISGNLDSVLRCTAIADAAGMQVWLQVAGLSLGIAAAFATHVGAVVKNATLPADTLHFLKENDLIGGALSPKNGHIKVPQSPGLGVELDEGALEKYRVG